MVERSLSMREVPGSMPGASNPFFSFFPTHHLLFISDSSAQFQIQILFIRQNDLIPVYGFVSCVP